METRRILLRSLAVALVIVVIWTTTANAKGKLMTCCTKVTTAQVTDPIISFRLQHESLPCVKAVIFETEQREFCSDHRQRWVQKKVKQFFQTKSNNHLTSTSPSTSSTSDPATSNTSTSN